MSDEHSEASGNRWEPTIQPMQPDRATAPTGRRTWFTRARAAVAGSAAVLLLAGGLGGFAIGRATADSDGAGGSDQRQGGRFGFDLDGDRGEFPGGPGGSQQGPPPAAQAPGTDSSDT